MYYVNGFKHYIQEIVRNCSLCQSVLKTRVSAPIFPVRSYGPNERYTMDYTQFAPNVWFLFVIANFSKRVWGEVYATKEEVNVIMLLSSIREKEGRFCDVLQSDNGGEFIGNDLIAYLDGVCIHIFGRPFHPQSQATIEKFNKTIKPIVAKYLLANNIQVFHYEELRSVLCICLDMYNRSVHSSTKCRPYELHYGITLTLRNPQYDLSTLNEFTINIHHLGEQLAEKVYTRMLATASRNQTKRNARNFRIAYNKHLYVLRN